MYKFVMQSRNRPQRYTFMDTICVRLTSNDSYESNDSFIIRKKGARYAIINRKYREN